MELKQIELPKEQTQSKKQKNSSLQKVSLQTVKSPASEKEQSTQSNQSQIKLKKVSDVNSPNKEKQSIKTKNINAGNNGQKKSQPSEKVVKRDISKPAQKSDTQTQFISMDVVIEDQSENSKKTQKSFETDSSKPKNDKVQTTVQLKKQTKSQTKKNLNNNQAIRKEKKYSNKPKYLSEIRPTGFTQDLLRVKEISNGIIRTNNNRYLMIMEIFPSNFYNMSLEKQVSIKRNFERFFTGTSRCGQFKTITERVDTETFVNHLINSCPYKDKKRLQIRDEMIRNIRDISNGYTTTFRFFYIFAYEGNVDGKYSNNFEDIYVSMMQQRNTYKRVLFDGGNLIAEPENPDLFVADTIYRLLNRKTCRTENIVNRILRINSDYKKYLESTGKDFSLKYINVEDYLAAKGTVFDNSEFIQQDGLYFTYMAIKDNGYPSPLPVDWINIIRNGCLDMDIDFFYKMLPREPTRKGLQYKRNFSSALGNSSSTEEKKEKNYRKSNASAYLANKMENEDLFDCCTLLTLYHEDPVALMRIRDSVRSEFKTKQIYVEISHNDVEEYFMMSLPFCNFENSIFKRNKRNMLTSTLSTVFMFTKYELSDPTGLVLGPNLENNTVFSPNPFNTGMFTNGNIIIIGTSGAGKTSMIQGIGRRSLMKGIKCYYIIPAKGHEHVDSCRDICGSYIRMGPGNGVSLNIMELWPEITFRANVVNGITEDDQKAVVTSVLSKKITFLCSWFKGLAKEDESPMKKKDINNLNRLLTRLYNDYGFTKDNDSIWEDKEKGIKKYMPTLSIWQSYMKNDPELEQYASVLDIFTKGTFKNFDEQTNVDLSNDYIVFDCDVDEVGEEMHPHLLSICVHTCENMIRADEENFGIIFVDESWKLLYDEDSAKDMDKEARIIRGYGGAIISSSQQLKEFVNNEYSSTLISNSSIMILMQIKESEGPLIKEKFGLSQDDINKALKLNKGEAIFISQNAKVKFKLQLALEELFLYTTDLNEKKKYKDLIEQRRANSSISQARAAN